MNNGQSMMRKDLQDNYLEDPNTCPYCNRNLFLSSPDADVFYNRNIPDLNANKLWLRVNCTGCNRAWIDTYNLEVSGDPVPIDSEDG
jgi:hypothetical protein